jgi:peptidyl-prolyl cis-trans isomerase SurA
MTARHRLAAAVAAALLAPWALAACSGDDSPEPESSASASADQAQPDVSGLPDVVAVVDDVEISKAEFVTAYEAQFSQLAAQAQQSGQPLDQDQLKQQTAESMVNTQLLINEADDRGYEVTQKDLDSTLDELAEQSGVTADELLDSLEKQGVDRKEANRQLEGQVKLDRLVADEGGDEDPTDKQLRELYDQSVAQLEQSGDDSDVPEFDEVKSQLEDQVRSQNETTVAQKLVDDLKKDADITINL